MHVVQRGSDLRVIRPQEMTPGMCGIWNGTPLFVVEHPLRNDELLFYDLTNGQLTYPPNEADVILCEDAVIDMIPR